MAMAANMQVKVQPFDAAMRKVPAASGYLIVRMVQRRLPQ